MRKRRINNYIIFSPNTALGDSIVGCASAFLLSKILDLPFKITNGRLKINGYFDIPDNYKINTIPRITYQYIPNKENDSLFAYSNLDIFKKGAHIECGSNFYRFLYRNNNFKDKIDIKEEDIIKYLFENILIPKKEFIEKLHKFCNKYDIKNSVVVNIRMLKFKNMKDNNNPLHVKTLDRFIECFKNKTSNNKFIVVTDNLELIDPILREKGINDIITYRGEITHSLSTRDNNYEKVLIDMLIIGEAKHAIISYWSNFGRIGVLRCKNNFSLVEPEFMDMNYKGRDWSKEWRDKDDPIVKNFREGNFKEILSKEKSFI